MHMMIFQAHQMQNSHRICGMAHQAIQQTFYHRRAHQNLEAPISYLTYRNDTIAIGWCHTEQFLWIAIFNFNWITFFSSSFFLSFALSVSMMEINNSRLSPGDSNSSGKNKSHRYCRHAQGKQSEHFSFSYFPSLFTLFEFICFRLLSHSFTGSTPSHGGMPNLDSGKSSDSSLSSSYRHGHDSGSLRMDQRSKHLADNT